VLPFSFSLTLLPYQNRKEFEKKNERKAKFNGHSRIIVKVFLFLCPIFFKLFKNGNTVLPAKANQNAKAIGR